MTSLPRLAKLTRPQLRSSSVALAVGIIADRLKAIDGLYREAFEGGESESGDVAFMLSRLAVIEFCSWIEFALDEVVRQAMGGTREAVAERDKLIKGVWGFRYEEDFRRMFREINGIARTREFDRKVSASEKSALVSKLLTMTKLRNSAAHGWGNEGTPEMLAPSKVIRQFEEIYPMLQRLHVAAGSMRISSDV